MNPSWFEGDGWFAVAVAATFFLVAGGTLLWLRGLGSRPHDPTVVRDRVRWFAVGSALFGSLWIVRANVGIGGFFVACGILIVVSLAFLARARLRRS